MTTLIKTEQATHSDTSEALAVSDMRFVKGREVTTGYSREKHLLLTAPPQVAVQAGGTPVGPDATPRLAFAAAGCDFKVVERPIFANLTPEFRPGVDYLDGVATLQQIPGHKAIVREGSNETLGVVSKGYHPVQNESFIALFEFLREDATLENIVAVNGGRKVFATASVNLRGEVKDGDSICRYLHAFNSFDGTTAFGVFFSDMRLVCSNQLRYISGRGARKAKADGVGLSLRHTKQVEEFAKRLPELIDLQNQRFQQDLSKLKPLTTLRVNNSQFIAILERAYADKLAVPVVDKDTKKKRQRTLADLEATILPIEHHAFRGSGIGLDPADHSAWNVLQAISQFETHEAGKLKDPLANARARLESLWGGAASHRLDRAQEACLALV
jgi:phage/plasmid-like protein (TIGR03299 family)